MDKASPRFKADARCGRRAAIVVLAFALSAPARASPLSVAVFPFELDDTSLTGALKGPQPAEQARLARLDTQLRAALAGSGRYVPVDAAPVARELATRSLRGCDDCAATLARRLGAEVSVNGWVQKVSELILNINLVMRDAHTGAVLRAGSVDIRGNTDESWSRGLAWLLRHRILNDAGATP